MNWRAVWAITRKDVRILSRSKSLWPMLVLPVVLMVLIPSGIVLFATGTGDINSQDFMRDIEGFMTHLPAHIAAELEIFDTQVQRLIYLIVVYQFAPMYLMVPLLVSTVVGADSFAGEKERKTLEALIYSPATDFEIYLGKMLSAWLPAVVIGLLSAVVYIGVAHLTAWSTMGRLFFPNAMWLVLVLWLMPAAAGLGLAAITLISSRVTRVQEAYQLGGLLVLPVVALMVAQMGGAVYLDIKLVFAIGAILAVIDVALIKYGASTFQRSELIAKI